VLEALRCFHDRDVEEALVARTVRTAILTFALAVTMAAFSADVASAQAPASAVPPDAPATSDMLKAIDQLTEQNRQLEKQNQQLMDQITVLRQTLVAAGAAAPPLNPPAEAKVYGGNWYPSHNRNWRLNLHVISIDHSPRPKHIRFLHGAAKGHHRCGRCYRSVLRELA
jgi:hypothetical protein